MCRKRHNAPDLRAAGMFNLSVIPDWETIGSARRRLSSLDHFSEEVNPQALNRVPWNGGDSPSQQTKARHSYYTVTGLYYYWSNIP